MPHMPTGRVVAVDGGSQAFRQHRGPQMEMPVPGGLRTDPVAGAFEVETAPSWSRTRY
jgi:hypothetical protein